MENPELVKNGKKKIQIKDKTGVREFERQIISTKKGGNRTIPIDSFLGERRRGKSVISKNLEKEAIEECLETSYRKSSNKIQNKFSRETVRRRVIEKGEIAKKLEKTTKKKEIKSEIKDADRMQDNYKKSKEGVMRKLFGEIFTRKILYFMADGVGIEQQGEVEGKRECKVGVFLRQNCDKVEEIATFCTWERIHKFKTMTEWILLGIFSTIYPIVIISDGAKWIRNLRTKIACLKNAKWILDWFHLHDRTLKLLGKFALNEEDPLTQEILLLYWLGQAEAALSSVKELKLSSDIEEAKQQKEAIRKYAIYIENQKEGIINYQSYKMKGYIVGSGCVEKMNDRLIKDRMVRQKRMRWGIEGGEAMIQLLVAQWNGRLNELFV